MTRSPFVPKSQPTNSVRKSSSVAISIVQLVILGLTITIIAAIFVQNLQPAVQIFFLGQKTLPIPLSVAMLVAFVGGGILSFVINAIAAWRHSFLIRRAVIASGYGKEEKKEQFKSSNLSTQQTTFQKNVNEDFDEDDEEDEYDDELEEEEDELYDEEDDDPDTVPYGDRQNLKSAKPKQPKRDRPPLDAKFIK